MKQLRKHSPAQKAGIRPGMVVKEVNGRKVYGTSRLEILKQPFLKPKDFNKPVEEKNDEQFFSKTI